MRTALLAAGVLSLLVIGALSARGFLPGWRANDAGAGSSYPRAPEGSRIKVEVLNATGTRGLAMRVTRHLRTLGYDVVSVGNAPPPADSLLVLDRSGNGEWARSVARSLGGAQVEVRPDSSRHLDVTVIVGSGWTPPPGPFDP